MPADSSAWQCLGGPMDGRVVMFAGLPPKSVMRFGPGQGEYEFVHMIARDATGELEAVHEAYAWSGLTEQGTRELLMQPIVRWMEADE